MENSLSLTSVGLCNSGSAGASGVVQIEDASGEKEEHFLENGFLDYLNKVLVSSYGKEFFYLDWRTTAVTGSLSAGLGFYQVQSRWDSHRTSLLCSSPFKFC